MKFIHEVDPSVNYVPVYSIEWKDERVGMWAQHARTTSKWEAYALAFEVWMRYRKHPRRVRVL